jgi:hypothetical protein
MIKPLHLALLFSLVAGAEALAQPAPRQAGFGGLIGGRTITVVDESGRQTKGRVLRFTPDQLTLSVQGSEVSFDRQNVTAVYEHGNSVKKGMIIGLLSGPALGFAALVTEGGDPYLLPATVLFSAMGFAVGTAIDALIPGRRLVYASSKRATDSRRAPDFSSLAARHPVIVADDSGAETNGQLVRFTAEELTVRVNGQERTFARERVAAIFERGDSVKNGMRNGFLTGAALGVIPAIRKTQCGREPMGIGFITVPSYYSPCTTGERLTQGLREGMMAGLLGMGIGAGIDALIPGRRLLYDRQRTPAASISIAPQVMPARIGLLTSVSW